MRASTPPNVVGYPLDEARAVLAEAGWADIEATETRPPRGGLLEPYRVLRQRLAGGRIALVVSGERSAGFQSGGAASGPAAQAKARRLVSDQGVGDVANEDARP